jgi:predicted amino acid-binding ACT domain protein
MVKRGLTPVVPGFFGAGPDGSLTTLGRGGTDLTATLLARTLSAARVLLWKDVPGILTADPRSVPDARLLPQMHHREAAEVAYFGAKVLHPRALIPLDGSRIDLEVRSFARPEQPGTEVSSRRTLEAYPVKALATIRGQALVTVAGKGLMGVPGVAARTFEAVHAEGVSVSTIFQSSSESSIGFTLPATEAARAVQALEHTFSMELTGGLVDSVTARDGVAVIAVVGRGMAGTPGIAARVFSALAANGINVIAIAQGSSELNISFVVEEAQARDAARAVHTVFQLSKIGGGRPPERPRTDVVLLGFGRVGRAVAEQASSTDRERVRIVATLDRSGYVFDTRGISRRRLLRLAEGKDRGELLAALGGRPADAATALAEIAAHAVSRPVLVDVTADETTPLLIAGLEHGFDLVLANKKPLAGSESHYRSLLDTADASGRRLLYEATVGAGLPVIDTFRKLAASGDRVLRVDGCVSGTLGFVLSAVEEGRAFSEVVREAVDRGYARSGRPGIRRARPPRRPPGSRRGSQGPHPRAPARLPRPPPQAGAAGAGIVRPPAARRILQEAPDPGRALAPAGRTGGEAGPCPALRDGSDPPGSARPARGGAEGVVPRRSPRDPQPARLHDTSLPERAPRGRGTGRGSRGHRRRHPERHPVARGLVAESTGVPQKCPWTKVLLDPRSDRRLLRTIINPHLGRIWIDKLTRPHVAAMHSDLQGPPTYRDCALILLQDEGTRHLTQRLADPRGDGEQSGADLPAWELLNLGPTPRSQRLQVDTGHE